jgi:KDO2-lipid IV(A) lauroyltransferase
MWIRSIAMSRWGPGIGLFLVRLIPYRLAYSVGKILSRWVTRNPKAPMNQAIRANQAIVRGLPYDDPALDSVAYEVMKMNARGFIDFFKAIAGGENTVRKTCVIDEPLKSNLGGWVEGERGLIIIGPHLLGFDIFMLYLGVLGYPIQAISYPDPRGSYIAQNTLRRRFGFNITPLSVQTLRESLRTLQRGEVLMTAVDRPGLGGESLNFFGREVVLPVGPARLAVKTNSRVIAGVPYLDENGIYHGFGADIFDPPNSGDEKKDALEVAQRVLAAFEISIRKWPENWLMFYPVWPDVIPSED